MQQTLMNRFITYAKFDTQSRYDQQTYPSTNSQLVFANILADECKQIGLQDVHVDKFGYVIATLPSNITNDVPTIGFLAHMDTAPDFSGTGVNPQIIQSYDGNDITLLNGTQITLKEFPILKNYVGQTLITTDGNTLLGADDKAGIAEIITAMEFLINNNIPHGNIKIAFTPDEEIGQGVAHFDVKAFGADYAFTMDGGKLGELEFESFNACGVKIHIDGKSIHPGSAKGIMVNAASIGAEFLSMLPKNQAPEHTSGYEGFYHLLNFEGNVTSADLNLIIRDFYKGTFAQRKEIVTKIVGELNIKYNKRIKLEIKDQYYNMGEIIQKNEHIMDKAKQAYEKVGVVPIIRPIRGGTDGSGLSFMGLPCPNIFAGGDNFHGPFEYIAVESMVKATNIIVEICRS